ncbi:MAG: glycosyltransferase family 2 protein [Lachnospiraceae bacterium]|nr:glycosyltransferase family 2 protein [Lachnospiraceae bacterium]MBP3754220.1 glycosyltransferase family 2 protein [Lachnospiraceae bacterium]
MSELTVIVPCKNEEEAIPLFYKELVAQTAFLEKRGTELKLIFIDDGSDDKTVEVVRGLHDSDPRVHMISFSRNFGKEAAMYAGLRAAADSDYAVIMDADLQDPPSLLEEMFSYIDQGYDSVATRRVTRKGEPPIRSFFARRFYKVMKKLSDTEIMDGARDYRLMTNQFISAVLSMTEYNRFTKGIFGWVGYETKWIDFENVDRSAGKTKWNFWGLVLYSLEGITAFSTKPLVLSSLIGIILCFISFVMILFIIVRWLIFRDPVAGWPSLMTVIVFVGGLQFFCTGILGQYIAKAYLEVKERPLYLKNEKNCF